MKSGTMKHFWEASMKLRTILRNHSHSGTNQYYQPRNHNSKNAEYNKDNYLRKVINYVNYRECLSLFIL